MSMRYTWIPVEQRGVPLHGFTSTLWAILVTAFCDYGFNAMKLTTENVEKLRGIAAGRPEYADVISTIIEAIQTHGEIEIQSHI